MAEALKCPGIKAEEVRANLKMYLRNWVFQKKRWRRKVFRIGAFFPRALKREYTSRGLMESLAMS